jgi:citrate synthase
MAAVSWKTAISQIKPNEVRLRGYRIDELMGQVSFAQAIHLALRGELPSPEVGRLMDAMLVSSLDHGVTPPSTQAARVTASTGAPLNAAVAAGVLSINRHHGGAIYDCMGALNSVITRAAEAGGRMAEAAAAVVDEYRQSRRKIAGFGHRVHTQDPRTVKLLALAAELGLAGQGIAAARAVEAAFAAVGRPLPVNVDGAIAALLIDLDIPPELANAFFIMARVPGLVAQVYEEQSRQPPMRRIDPREAEYDGPEARELSETEDGRLEIGSDGE